MRPLNWTGSHLSMHFYGAYSYIAGVLRQRYFTINIITGERNKINPNAYILVSASISLYNARTDTLYYTCYLSTYAVAQLQFCSPLTWNLGGYSFWEGEEWQKHVSEVKLTRQKYRQHFSVSFFRHEAKIECC